MFTDLIINTPLWFLFIVILVGLSYSLLLYYKNKKSKLGKTLTTILFISRFVVITLLAFLLLSPFLKTKIKQLEKPVVVLGIDNSRSMVLTKDSAIVKSTFLNRLNGIIEQLEEKYKVDIYAFGKDVKLTDKPQFDDEATDYSNFIMKVKETYAGMNLGALVIAGDGINNRGIDPVFAASNSSVPIYTIALGDTLKNTDLKINDVRFNSLTYLNDDFPVEVNVSGRKLKGETALLKIYAFGKQQARQRININAEEFSRTYQFMIKASESGKQRMFITLETEAEEIHTENNSRNIFFDVLDNRQKILMLTNAPHPDIAAIKQGIEQNKNFELELAYANEFKGVVNEYDLIILYQLPSIYRSIAGVLKQIKDQEIPTLYILGKQSNINLFNKQYAGVDLRIAGQNFEDAQADINRNFSLFTFDETVKNDLEKFPPLIVQLGNYQVLPTTSVFATQRINNLLTDYPLVAFSPIEGIKNGFIAGEGLWMWRMHNYLISKNAKSFDTFIEKVVQLLLLRKDKRFFRVKTKGEYTSHQNVVVKAELYNQSYEAVNTSDVNFVLKNEDGEAFNFLFSLVDQAYMLDLKHLPVGVYKYSANTRLGQERYATGGEFVVTDESFESMTLQADHAMLYRLATQNDGNMLYPGEIQNLPDILAERQTMKSKIYYEEKYTGLFNLWWVVGLILFLLSLEWFLRKYFGTY